MKTLFKVEIPAGAKRVMAGLALTAVMIAKAQILPVLEAAPVKLAWDPSPNSSVAGYKVRYGLVNALIPLTNSIDTGHTMSATIPGLSPGANYFFYVTAYDSGGFESPPSNMLVYAPPVLSKLTLAKQANGSMQINFRAGLGAICQVQYASSPNAVQWQTLATATADLNGNVKVTDPLTGHPPMRFYRAVHL